MELLVGLEEGIDSPVACGGFEDCVNIAQLRNIGGVRPANRISRTTPPDQGHQGEDVVEILTGNFGDVAAAAWLEFDQPL